MQYSEQIICLQEIMNCHHADEMRFITSERLYLLYQMQDDMGLVLLPGVGPVQDEITCLQEILFARSTNEMYGMAQQRLDILYPLHDPPEDVIPHLIWAPVREQDEIRRR